MLENTKIVSVVMMMIADDNVDNVVDECMFMFTSVQMFLCFEDNVADTKIVSVVMRMIADDNVDNVVDDCMFMYTLE